MNSLPFQILLALAGGELTAGEVLSQIAHDTEGSYWMPERTFYSALPVLVKKGWIIRQGMGRGARYRLSPDGRRQLQWENTRVQQAAKLLNERL